MITPSQAEALIQQYTLSSRVEFVSIDRAMNRILKEDLLADSDLPPFNRVMMDGVALNYSAIERGLRSFPIQAMQRAGEKPLRLEGDEFCIEIMTGAVCSEGCDTVVPYEHLRIVDGVAHIEVIPSDAGKNVHRCGSDKQKGEVLCPSNMRIGPAEIGIAASIGKASLKVKGLPRVLICSTGDELTDIQETPLPHQIRRSNVYALKALIQRLDIESTTIHIADDRDKLKTALVEAFYSYDVILLSGGVSKGKFDLLPNVLRELGVTEVFHGIEQRPGKPMWFGHTATCAVFALPGNPISTIACAARYVMPWLREQLEGTQQPGWYTVDEKPKSHEKLTLLVPVTIKNSSVKVMGHQGSGDFSALSGMAGFIEVGPGETEVARYLFFPV